MSPDVFVKNVKDFARRHDLNQPRLARVLRVAQPSVSNWFSGHTKPYQSTISAVTLRMVVADDILTAAR